LSILVSGQSAAAMLPGQVSRVIDGDSIVVRSQGNEYPVRLAGIDAPELNQPWGESAARELHERLLGRFVVVDWYTKSPSGELLGVVRLHGDDQNLYMLAQGLAWCERRPGRERVEAEPPPYIRAENDAREAGRGLWSAPDPIAPWDWRRMR
jgi:endonuclease YncB( thermonuclease family)